MTMSNHLQLRGQLWSQSYEDVTKFPFHPIGGTSRFRKRYLRNSDYVNCQNRNDYRLDEERLIRHHYVSHMS